jgi:TRAP-type C4-dicarboxylate transport system permease large subunit
VKHVRNIAILAVIALAIVAIPGGGTAAGIVSAVLSLAIAALIAYFVGRLYRDRRVEIYGLGDLDRGILYAACAGIVVLLAASQEWSSTGGTLIEFAGLCVCLGGLLRVYQTWRSY